MARLNEPTAPTESIETLKRKFLRQNREIAKVNSNQAVRIRALENEVARLLTDNLNTRGHIIRLERELENNRSRHQHVDDLRSQMQEKLGELGALFKDFDGRPSPKKRKSTSPRELNKTARSTPAKSPGTKDWKNHCALGETSTAHESRFPPTLPAIIENKYYPRRTLEQNELVALKEASDNTDSPELEPPPISHFIENPVKIDFPAKTPTPEVRRSPSNSTFSTAMLDQRRKRRESVGVSDIRRLSGDEVMLHEEIPDSLKVGAKRKVSVREEDERASNSQISPDDFKYTRKSVEETPASKATECTEKPRGPREIATAKTTSREGSRERKSSIPPASGRKALAPKATNEDVKNSPRKKAADEKQLPKAAPLQERPKSRARKTEIVPSKTAHPPVAPKIDILPDPEPEHHHDPEPETPAAQDIISPVFSEPSARPITRDTPPPTDIGHAGVTDHGRPGRRARSSVSYAEPNLRDKMRRPTKELVDAVTTKPTIYVKIEDEEPYIDTLGPIAIKPGVYIKREPFNEDAWSVLAQTSNVSNSHDPGSPLIGKKAPSSTQKSITVNDAEERPISAHHSSTSSESVHTRRTREKALEPFEPTRPTPSSSSTSNTRHTRTQAISGVEIKETKHVRHSSPLIAFAEDEPDSLEPTAEKIRKFVRKEEEAGRAPSVSKDGKSTAITSSALKRNNSNSKRNSALPLQMQLDEAGEESDVDGTRKRRGVSLVAGNRGVNSRRKSVAVLADVAASSSSSSGAGGLVSSSSMPDFRAGVRRGGGSVEKGGPGGKEKEKEGEQGGRARQERVNARRRSMIV